MVRAAISNGLIPAAEVARRWTAYRELPGTSRPRFWRFIADSQGAEKEAYYSMAAATYGFHEAEISVPDVTAYIKEVRALFTKAQWQKMRELQVLPIGSHADVLANIGRPVFVSPDPTRLEVNNFLSALPIPSFVLQYAPAQPIDYVLDFVLPALLAGEEVTESAIQPRLHLIKPNRSETEDLPAIPRAA